MKPTNLLRNFCLTILISLFVGMIGFASVELPTDVSKPSSSTNQIVGIQGQYIADCQKALNRMNEIRYEACKEGVKNPATNKKLTLSDYSPLKWSSDMEYIARIRAAESSITMDHVRTNGKSCFAIKSKNGYSSSCEVIAWNFSQSMTLGVEQWYREKSTWVSGRSGVTGHYEAIIDPTLHYVGLGTFYSENTRYYNTTVGEFSAAKSGLSTTMGTSADDVIQKLEVTSSCYKNNKSSFVSVTSSSSSTSATVSVQEKEASAVKTVSLSVNKSSVKIAKGKAVTLKVTVNPTNSTEKVTYKSSNKTVATVSSSGVIKAKKAGKANITVTSGAKKVVVKVTVK